MLTALRWFALVLALVLALAAAAPALGQVRPLPDMVMDPAPARAERPDPQALRELAATLKNPDQREQFLQRLDTLIQAQQERRSVVAETRQALSATLRELAVDRWRAAQRAVHQAWATLARVPGALARFVEGLADPATRWAWLTLLARVAVVLGAGIAGELLVRRLVRRARSRVPADPGLPTRRRALLGLGRALVRLLPLAGFGAGIAAGLPLAGVTTTAGTVVRMLALGWVAGRAAMVAVRYVLAPGTPVLRLVPVTDPHAVELNCRLRRVVSVGVGAAALPPALSEVGVAAPALDVLAAVLWFLAAWLVAVFVVRVRQPVARALLGPPESPRTRAAVPRYAAAFWYVPGVAFIAALYAAWALSVPGGPLFLVRAGLLTLAVLVAAAWGHRLLDRALARCLDLGAELRATHPELEPRANRVLPMLRRATGWLVNALAVLAVLEVWGAGLLAWIDSAVGRTLLSAIVTVAVAGAVLAAAWEALDALIARRLTRSAQRDNPKRAARMATLLPLVRNALRAVLILLGALLILPELGVNIGPLLAGAGVVGIAIGFGAQTLVRDLITGIFILVEDSFSVGDWVSVGGHEGEVQALTMRTVAMRDLSGYLHVVPFSQVTTILNMTRDHAYALVDIPVAYREDEDAVAAELRAAAEELQEDPEWSPVLLGALEIFGLERMTEAGMEIRVRIKTRPLMHWKVRRELLRRAKQRFEARGMAVGVPHRTLAFTEDRDGDAAPARVVVREGGDRRARASDPGAAPAAPASPLGGDGEA